MAAEYLLLEHFLGIEDARPHGEDRALHPRAAAARRLLGDLLRRPARSERHRRGVLRAQAGRHRSAAPGDAARARVRARAGRDRRCACGRTARCDLHEALARALRAVRLARAAGHAAGGDPAAALVRPQHLRLRFLGARDDRRHSRRDGAQAGLPAPTRRRRRRAVPAPADRGRITFPRDRRPLSWRNAFLAIDELLRAHERSPLEASAQARAAGRRASGSSRTRRPTGRGAASSRRGCTRSSRCSAWATRLDHPVMARGLEGCGRLRAGGRTTLTLQPCLSPVWDTALAVIALREAGLPPDHPALCRRAAGCWSARSARGGDWQVKARRTSSPAAGRSSSRTTCYPDIDDTAEVLIALRPARCSTASAQRRAAGARPALAAGMQIANGGWGAFDKDNTRRFVTQIPFCDFGAMLDPPSEDVTAHVVECASRSTAREPSDATCGAPSTTCWRTQERDGRWFGRWGVNYVYGAGAALPALVAAGDDTRVSRGSRRAVRWLEDHQNADGGWGETCASYDDASLRGRGREHRLADGLGAARPARGGRGATARPRGAASTTSSRRRQRTASGTSRTSPAPASRATSCSSITCTATTGRSWALGRYRASHGSRAHPPDDRTRSADLLAATPSCTRRCRAAGGHARRRGLRVVPAVRAPRTMRTSRSSPGSCRDACARTSSPSTPSAAGPTTWATRLTGDRLALLDEWEQRSARCYEGRPQQPLFWSRWRRTIEQFDIPIEPFLRLIEANRMDQRIHSLRDLRRPAALLPALRRRRSGRMVLSRAGLTDEERRRLSDCTCIALQLTNFWQDVSGISAKGRIYIPLEDMARCSATARSVFATRIVNDAFRALMRFEVERARDLFAAGPQLEDLVDRRCRADVRLFRLGGEAVLGRSSEQDYDVLHRRPARRRAKKLWMALSNGAAR